MWRLQAVWKYHCPGGCYVFMQLGDANARSFHCPKSWFWKGK